MTQKSHMDPRARPRATAGSDWQILGRLLPIAALVVFGVMLAQRMGDIDTGHVWASLQATTPAQWALSGLATFASFCAVGQYDAGVHKLMATGVAPVDARRAGMRAIALGQTLGFGSLTGALVRWRCLPALGLWRTTQISVLVSLSFLAAWAVVAALMVALTGLPLPGTMAQTLSGATALIGLAAVATFFMLRKTGARTGLGDLGAMLLWCLIDTGCAALALYVLLPSGVAPAPALFFTAYLLALGAGLLSNAPGGIGAFDLALLACLPMVDDAAVLAALIAFRVTYYAVPAALAFVTLLRAPRAAQSLMPLRGLPLARALQDPPHPEWALCQQGASLWSDGQNGWMVQAVMGHACAIGTPKGAADHTDIARIARRLGRRPALYKCGAVTALRARRAGWAVRRIGAEALITPAQWSLEGPQHRQLRRKLRHAEKTVTISQPATLPIAEMRLLARAWATRHGGEKGVSMGRFDLHALREQRVFLAHAGETLIGFVTFHTSADAWSLDLMRHGDDLPDGTMHALIVAAITAAQHEGIAALGLAAAPIGLPERLARPASGLIRFKQSFAPRWQPLYLCAPSWIAVLRAGLVLAYAIHHPPRLRGTSLARQDDNLYAENTFENGGNPCHGPVANLTGWG
ncbi:phosphatidylglycerol lysyltransferase domain-containing protein [Octadecabacter sp. R77987]|uniref:phosphatidylglycerol lysyltransferase domain-containing protein n=1 Tax=Octadecabacter sp. R77987 TaxID=3093874 RepID=UPI00366A8F4B